MAQITAPGNLQTAQTGNGDSTNTILDVDWSRPAAIRITSTVGATPTVTVAILGSIDGVNFYNIPYALVATPSTFVIANITITAAVTTFYLLQTGQAWNYVKLNMSANTNVTLTSDYL
jgi:hypothetical protein